MRILLAWEIGSGFGHITKLAPIARALHAHTSIDACELTFAIKEPTAATLFADDVDCRVLQAPFHPVKSHANRGTPLVYSDDLRACGYADADVLTGLLRAWRDLYDLLDPDVLIVDSAPTALVAARGFDISCVSLAGGYGAPPRTAPLSPIPYWTSVSEAQRAKHEHETLRVLNQACERFNLPPYAHFFEVLEGAELAYVASFEGIDHYPDRAAAERDTAQRLGRSFSPQKYIGPLLVQDRGLQTTWDASAQHRILGYLPRHHPGLEPCLKALSGFPSSTHVILAVPGIAPALVRKYGRPHVRIFDQALRIRSLLADCDVGISHGGIGITHSFALAGCPQLVFPFHVEQVMVARALGRLRIGRGMVGQHAAGDILKWMKEVLHNPQYHAHAQKFAEQHADFSLETPARRIADDIVDRFDLF